jgi:very-short-patch-repair endonuclease
MVTTPTAKARSLRNNMTEPEVWLWARLKRLQARGFHFRRQRPFKGYYLDFVCIDRKLVVEVDGAHHQAPLQAEHDGVRDRVLRRHGYEVLRFSNSRVRTNIDGVVDAIVLALDARPSTRGMDRLRAGAPEPDSPTRPALRAGHPPLKRRDERE